jgi:8-oxo-dGTP pyrophosphatase MutT (NUDIX family)
MKTYVSIHLVCEDAGKHLLIRRAGSPYFPGYLSLVAGHVEADETPVEALVREVAEEIGVTLSPRDLNFRNVVYRRLPDRIYVDYFFGTEDLPASPRIVEHDKITELGYFDIADHRDEIVPYVFMALSHPDLYLEFDETGRPAGT